MTSLLVKDALSTTWGNPDPYNQVILKPARISAINGVNKRVSYAWSLYGMPNATSRFHVYQTGQIFPVLLNLFQATSQWQLLSEASTTTKVMIDIYTQLGVQLPRTRSWYRWVDKKNILIAVEINPRIDVDWPELEVFLRIYRNEFFDSQFAGANDKLVISGGIMSQTSDLTALQTEAAAITNAAGYSGNLIAFVNGIKRAGISLVTAAVGDVVEYVYDTSIYKIVDFPIAALPGFTSTLDHKAKALLHYDAPEETLIDYEDHIDAYVFDVTTNRGVYFHRNAEDAIRQLTHKDYSIAVDYLPSYYAHFKDAHGVVNINNLRLRLHIRYSGQGLAPKLDANMSKYLMDMNALNQVQAMVGVQASFPLWQAANLEASAYMQLLRSKYTQIDTDLVQRAYGYARVNAILGKAVCPVTVVDSASVVNIPPTFQASATAFEYDASGKLLEVHACGADTLFYYPTNANCTTVEFVEGLGGKSIDEIYGSNPVALSSDNSYRFYLKVTDSPLNTPTWQDVTGTTHYTVESGVAYWAENTITNSLERIVRSDKKFLSYEIVLDRGAGILIHQINYDKLTTRGLINSALAIPLGELDLWLNDHPLVRGVDYLLHFPTISIINKSFLVDPAPGDPDYQRLRVRMTGFCDSSLQINPINETGFVFEGVLSANSRFDLHLEKIQRVVVNGALKRVDEITFAEEGPEGQALNTADEGKPYEIRDVINRLNGLITEDAYTLYRLNRDNEAAAQDYLSQRVAQVNAFPVSPIANRYELFSPFLAKILNDLIAGYIDLSEFVEPYSDALVRSLCVPYQYLLVTDPIGPGNLPDANYCVIHPHSYSVQLELTLPQYAFFERVVSIFAGDKVVYTSLVHLAP